MIRPPVEPYDCGLLEVGDRQRIYWETVGNPNGKPAIMLHGGPGAGCSVGHRRTFDPQRYRGVLFDQRNCGRSLPHAAEHDTELGTNTTEYLIGDIELLREHLGIERWLVLGGSWGSTLAFAYAQRHPERVTELVHIAVTNTSAAEIDWLYGGVGRFFPQAWDRFRRGADLGPEATGTELAAGYDRLLSDADPAIRTQAALEWCAWEDAVVELDAGRNTSNRFDDDRRRALAFARLCAHYFSRHGFLADGELLANAQRLRDIPTVLIHGQLDLGSPVVTAWRMAQALPHAELHIVPGAGHASGAGMSEALRAALDRFGGGGGGSGRG